MTKTVISPWLYWFGAYAPFDNPEIVVVAFGENSGGGGGSVAGPMALKVMESYFKHNPPDKKKVQPQKQASLPENSPVN